ncbi:ParB N-terminal domain-containing protein [uncultured Tateyamaria sp.]|uniref:ParB/RepB/Spo0J family partition protein n=1 Tax=uncultured Tateyamaria sp. TaxID=455651 RepID=UPI00262F80A1|nr:ParB N-terminal domain-containing protein [uncultured Tateyamaria sp.]
MTDIKDLPLTSITTPENRARFFDPLKTQALASSIAAQGLFHPITVRPVPDTDGEAYELVSGLCRYRAVEMNGAATIVARISDLDDDAARLAEVMENLARAELIALDRCQHLYELKVVYERMYPETAHGKASPKTKSLRLSNCAPEIFGFAEHVAEQIGLSKRTIQIAVAIWKGLVPATLARLYGTDIARKQTELKALSELSPVRQEKVLDLIFDEGSDVGNVAGAVAALEGGGTMSPMAKAFERLRVGFAALPDESLDRLIDAQAERVIASLKRTGRL